MKRAVRLCSSVLSLLLLLVTLNGCTSETAAAPVSNIWYEKNPKNDYYRVRQGDTLYSVAWMFGLDYRALAAENGIAPPYSVSVGQTLKMTNVPIGMFKVSSRKYGPHKQVSSSRVLPHSKARPLSGVPTLLRSPPGQWFWPAKGKVIHQFKKGYASNTGIDISGHYREPIRAASSGIVVYSGAGVRGYGNLIILKHSSSYLSAYAYNNRLLVALGERVKRGQKIAWMGRNDAGKTLLHFEIRKNGRPVDPMRYLKRR